MSEEIERSNVTIYVRHVATRPPDLGTPLNRKTPEAAYQATPDETVTEKIHEALARGNAQGIIEEVVTTPTPDKGFTEIKAFFTDTVSPDLASEFVVQLCDYLSVRVLLNLFQGLAVKG
jgi:hypothetical protein